VKLGIIGVGAVGAATDMAVVLRARVRELVLIDKERSRARGSRDRHALWRAALSAGRDQGRRL
jgi:malate/lactate dehydrogenase